MAERYLTILEVSQKQAYIFASNKLADNVENSATIAYVMSAKYFEKVVDDVSVFNEKDNLVYSGGGHIVLEFQNEGQAAEAVKRITTDIHRQYPGIEVFAKTIEYRGTNPGSNMKELVQELEKKKSIRASAFHQGTFGIEEIDTNTAKPKMLAQKTQKSQVGSIHVPEGFVPAYMFSELGGSKDESNFIAVVHIDGNAMGKRVENLQNDTKNEDWDSYKASMRKFSEGIATDFSEAYDEMAQVVADNLNQGNLKDLDLKDKKFPVRKIIAEGDDICFVCDGRIGIECAVQFIKALTAKKNDEDDQGYSACAGVAIVHQKYPFYKAYELAEMLCSNAKKFGANLSEDGVGKDISSIDWHIEYGELKESLEEIRQEYHTADGKKLEMRPYVIAASDEILEKEKVRRYDYFKQLTTAILNKKMAYARGKLKELRPVLKQGEEATQYYLKFNKIESVSLESYQGIYKESDFSDVEIGSGKELERKTFIKTNDGIERSILFDAIEIIDTYLPLKEVAHED